VVSIMTDSPHRRAEIFSDGFETGDVGGWS